MRIKHVFLYADGGCSGNPGPGGWGTILKYGNTSRELSGGDPDTTNNRMELTGVIEGLKALTEPCKVTVTSDSRYVVDAISKGWAAGWKKNGWKRSGNKPALNVDLWEELLELLKIHNVDFQWIAGHTGHAENERCDTLAVEAYQKYL